MKIAIGGIATESCTFSPLPTTIADFRFTRPGDARYAELYPFLPTLSAAQPDLQFVGTVSAKALPGGPVTQRAYDVIKAEVLTKLEAALPLDGVYLDMHGAMFVAGMQDAEGDWMQSIRELVGARCLISASYDLHGNVSPRIMQHVDILTGYRTAPHVDTLQTRRRAMTLLLHCLGEGIVPRKAYVRIPIGLPGEKTSTEWDPGRSLYEAIPGEIDGQAVIDATVQVGYVWADEPRMSACAIAIGADAQAISAAATGLAQRFWRHRAGFRFGVEALPGRSCLQRALQSDVMPVLISDSGDNPTAGGVGDRTALLQEALDMQIPSMVYASVVDAQAVRECAEGGVGAELQLSIGGSLDPAHAQPLAVTGRVECLAGDDGNRMAVLNCKGIRIILTSQRSAFHRRQQFTELGIVPEQEKILVVKIGYLVPELKAMAKAAFLALTPGAVNQDIVSLPFQRVTRPCYPLDADMEWTPQVLLY